jgi:hypothetical protein
MTPQSPPMTRHEVATEIAHLVGVVDAHAREMNKRWGHNRLPYIVPVELAGKFKEQHYAWQKACFECAGSLLVADLERVRKIAEAMLRAYAALERAAIDGGMSPAPPNAWSFETEDGKPIIIVQTVPEIAQVDNPHGAQVWSLEEIGRIITNWPQLVLAKQLFPKAEVIQLRTPKAVIDKLDDELSTIPF